MKIFTGKSFVFFCNAVFKKLGNISYLKVDCKTGISNNLTWSTRPIKNFTTMKVLTRNATAADGINLPEGVRQYVVYRF